MALLLQLWPQNSELPGADRALLPECIRACAFRIRLSAGAGYWVSGAGISDFRRYIGSRNWATDIAAVALWVHAAVRDYGVEPDGVTAAEPEPEASVATERDLAQLCHEAYDAR